MSGGFGACVADESTWRLSKMVDEEAGQVALAYPCLGCECGCGQVFGQMAGDVVDGSPDEAVRGCWGGSEYAHLCLVAWPLQIGC
ncbi:hypothetical protein [Micromonospora sp. CPCC 206061]|uniref:hypothetical protein n=1 Tax=Micromonospora sp. CPCC 206061 TaxID=3122410 RepID=UPI002FF02F33